MFQKSVKRDIESNQFLHISESFKQWMETLGYKAQTVKLNYWNVQEFFAFLESSNIRQLKDFKSEQINQYLEYLQHRPNCNKEGGLQASYINKHITALRLLSKYLQLSGKACIMIKPDLLKTTETATYLVKAEIQSLYKAAKDESNLYNQRDVAMLSKYINNFRLCYFKFTKINFQHRS